jgi:hypothetical protein
MGSCRKPLSSPRACVSALLALLASCAAAAQGGSLFADDEPLTLRLETPLRTLLADEDDREYHPARILVAGEQDAPLAIDLRVRVRGKSRTEACEFPPLLLNFPREQPEGSPFAGENRLKLVTHCRIAVTHEQHVRLERQIYLALNLLTEESLRTRVVTVTYFDTERDREIEDRIGFLIEDEERFAERFGMTTVSDERIDAARYDAQALATLDVFEYFIGNTDWSALAGPAGESCCHNVVPFARPDGVLLPVPYDFDASGLVEAPYAQPDARLPIQSVRNRLYRGRCRELSELDPVFATFTAQRAAITALFTTEVGLTERNAARAQQYIDAFYEVLGNPTRAEREFRVNCAR